MTFKLLVREIEKYLRIQGAESNDLIKGFVNESILDFIRFADWEKLKAAYILPLDDSNVYDIPAILAAVPYTKFYSEIDIINESGKKYTKFDYETYLTATDKTGYASFLGTNLYLTGTNVNVNLIYLTTGLQYPLVDDDDEVPATIYYWDIIKYWTALKMLEFIGDDESIPVNEKILSRKLDALKKSESRTRQHGKLPYFNRI